MDIEQLDAYCMAKAAVTQSMPFDDKTLAYKVGSKIFILLDVSKPEMSFNAKCDPEKALDLREKNPQIAPGYHMNKKHWNTIACQGLKQELIRELNDHSYQLVSNSLSKKEKTELGLI